ncbi:MAG: TFIIB-type zinc ribbon-containing protein [Planctomycetota bacterium]|jgi:Zn-finger nucleic acid-binding protein
MSLCPGCGNEVVDTQRCPVCEAGRAPRGGSPRKLAKGLSKCPRCNEFLLKQDWDGVITYSCPNCRGTFFPARGLEEVLNKLRATCDPVDVQTVLKDFRDRFSRKLPTAIRYKTCPVCNTVMTRRNYATVSGVIVDACGDHGTWVDEAQFAALADFICRGGDVLATEVRKVRARISPGEQRSGGTLLDKFFGS